MKRDVSHPNVAQTTRALMEIFESLHAAYGPQQWWPADSNEEVVIGAILTQNTAWTNVEKAIAELKRADCLTFRAIDALDEIALAELIRSAGTFRQKATYLKAFARWLVENHDGELDAALSGEMDEVRGELLTLKGIGPETADAILLYAGGHPTFVVDAYAKRVLRRHYLIESKQTRYEKVRALFMDALPHDVRLFDEYHALLVEVGKRHCKSTANCEGCPLAHLEHDGHL
ncbi:MAG: endonuclease III domain-containing protein [Phycisphaerae bacterium]|nr:endonuclease III domain-containing protein [Phycisphaerales bacterium]